MPYLVTHPRRGFLGNDRVMHGGQNSNLRGLRGKVVGFHNGKVCIKWEKRGDTMEYSQDWAERNIAVSITCLVQYSGAFGGPRYVEKYAAYAKPEGWFTANPGTMLPQHAEMKREVDNMERVKAATQAAQVTEGLLYRLGLLMHDKPMFPCQAIRDIDGQVFNVRTAKEFQQLEPGMYTLKHGVPEEPKQEQKPAPKLDTRPVPEFPYWVRNKATGELTEIATQNQLEGLSDGEYAVLAKVSDLSIKPVKKSTISFS
ncbi:hypothetical protein PP651_gp68 [Aeromonas phage ZPAH14]|uniref:Uncharacterized protein n=1 Tax=Aeromonas phage ZPAH14 TaxID=2924887 RepID=A0AAE9KJD5_9CAUD|nr:hypothetical protein PP651_gp68 [Aeromonas phage ZPAH14]UOT58011.1 hypothetical protein [Aeromonas phage ZPAH14]